MASTNIDCFNEAMVRILATLYDKFPIPTDLNINDLCVDVDHLKGISNPRSIFFETVNFMALEGIIRHSSRSERGGLVFLEVTLTSGALVRLNMSPKSLQRSLIDEIKNQLALEAEKRSPQLIAKCVMEFFKDITK